MDGFSVVDAYGDHSSQFAQAMCLAAKQLPSHQVQGPVRQLECSKEAALVTSCE